MGIRQNRKIMRRILFLLGASMLVGCESKSVWDERFRESANLPAPTIAVSLSDPNAFTFAMVGDLHIGGSDSTRFRRILERAQAEGDAFVVLLGDIADKGEAVSFVAAQNALRDFGFENKVVPILGNHDIFGDGWIEYQKVWGSSHYSVDIGTSRFIALDTADGILGETQYDWLIDELARTSLARTFILSHYMPVVPGQQTYLRLANHLEAERLMTLASERGVKGVFGGHYHSFCQEKIGDVDYLVAGGGGGRRMEPVKDYFFVQAIVSNSNVQYQLRAVE